MLNLHRLHALRKICRRAAHQNLFADLKFPVKLEGDNTGLAKITVDTPNFLRLALAYGHTPE